MSSQEAFPQEGPPPESPPPCEVCGGTEVFNGADLFDGFVPPVARVLHPCWLCTNKRKPIAKGWPADDAAFLREVAAICDAMANDDPRDPVGSRLRRIADSLCPEDTP